MITFNQVTFVGNVGRQAEAQKTPEGTSVARFSLGVSTYAGKDDTGKAKKETLWLTVNCWRDLADQVQKLVTKGALVLVSGRLAVRKYTDKTGTEQTSVEVVATTVQLLEPKAKPVEDMAA
jgi:single-strand DNA-binding protein